MVSLVETKRRELIEAVANVDEQLCDLFLSDQTLSSDQIKVNILYIWLLIITSLL